jgi:hypothetical protein
MTKRILVISSPSECHTVTVRARRKMAGYTTEVVRVDGQPLAEREKGFVNTLFTSQALLVAARRCAEKRSWLVERLCFESADDQVHAAWLWDGGTELQVVDHTNCGVYLNGETGDKSWHRAEAWLMHRRAEALVK